MMFSAMNRKTKQKPKPRAILKYSHTSVFDW